jgi:hypothetical protein
MIGRRGGSSPRRLSPGMMSPARSRIVQTALAIVVIVTMRASTLIWPKFALLLAAAPATAGPDVGALRCFPTAETRHLIADRRLVDPFASMEAASSAAHAEPIAAKLCRDQEALIYEISVLRRDGRVMRIYLDATNGQPHAGHKAR